MSKLKPSILQSIKYIIARFLLRKQFLVGYSHKFNLKMKFKTEDGGGREIFKKGTYEDENSTFLKNNLILNPNDVFLDVGANIGWYSLLIDKYFQEVIAYAFEPDPVNIRCFEYNLQANNSKNVNLVKKAVSDKSGTQTMYTYKNSNKGRNSLLPINNHGEIKIEAIELDQFVKQMNISTVRFMKMDIEGYEYHALSGASQVLQNIELLLMEYAPGYMKKGNINPKDLLDLIANHHFHPYLLQNNELIAISYNQLLNKKNNMDLYLLKQHQTLIPNKVIKN